jgi:hypothetical protein
VLIDEVGDVIPETVGQPVVPDRVADQRGRVAGGLVTDLLGPGEQGPGRPELVGRVIVVAFERGDLGRFARPDRQVPGLVGAEGPSDRSSAPGTAA